MARKIGKLLLNGGVLASTPPPPPLGNRRVKYFSFIKIPGWLSAEFAETMFLLIDDLDIFDKAIEEIQ